MRSLTPRQELQKKCSIWAFSHLIKYVLSHIRESSLYVLLTEHAHWWCITKTTDPEWSRITKTMDSTLRVFLHPESIHQRSLHFRQSFNRCPRLYNERRLKTSSHTLKQRYRLLRFLNHVSVIVPSPAAQKSSFPAQKASFPCFKLGFGLDYFTFGHLYDHLPLRNTNVRTEK